MSNARTQAPHLAGQDQPPGDHDPPPAVDMNDVTKYYDGGLIKALNGLSLRVERGESVAVTGPSGCGKSTMLHLIAALDRPTSGTIRVGGADLVQEEDLPGYRRRHIGLVFQLHNLLPQLSAVQNVEVAMFSTGLSLRQRLDRARMLLADVDLAGLQVRRPDQAVRGRAAAGGDRPRPARRRLFRRWPGAGSRPAGPSGVNIISVMARVRGYGHGAPVAVRSGAVRPGRSRMAR